MTADPSTPPRSVLWLWSLRDRLLNIPRRRIALLIPLTILALLATGLTTIDSGSTGVRLRLGKLQRNDLQSGLVYSLPRPIDRLVELDTSEVRRLSVEGDAARMLGLVTGDENLIQARLTVQYRVSDPGSFLFRSEGVIEIVEQIVRAELVEAVASIGVDDVLTTAKSVVQQHVRNQSQERFSELDLGVHLVSVNLQSVEPPREAAEAFRDVVDSRARSAENVSRTSTEQDSALAQARAEANQLIRSAEVAAAEREQSASSTAQRFLGLLQRYRVARAQTRADLLAEARATALFEPRIIVLRDGQTPKLDVLLGSEDSP